MTQEITDLNERRGRAIAESTENLSALAHEYQNARHAVKTTAEKELARRREDLRNGTSEIEAEYQRICHEARDVANGAKDALKTEHDLAHAAILDRMETDTDDLATKYETDIEATHARLDDTIHEIDRLMADSGNKGD